MTQRTREQTKHDYLTYREKAAQLVADADANLRVELHANVQLCEGGAFVECLVWVPRELLS